MPIKNKKTSKTDIIKELDNAYELAKAKEQVKEMLSITMAKAKILGFDIDDEKPEIKQALVKFIE